MSSSISFQQAEDRYFILRGQLETGKLTRSQFEVELKQLMVQDTQGRYWIIGSDTGKWHYYDGANWIESTPPSNAPVPVSPPQPSSRPSLPPPESYATMPPPATFSSVPMAPIAPTRPSNNTTLLFVLGGIVLLCLVGALGVFFATSQGIIKIGQVAATNTVVAPSVVPSIVPSPIILIATNPAPTLPSASTALALPTTAPTVRQSPTPTVQPSPTITPTLTADQFLQQADALTLKSQFLDANVLYDKAAKADPKNALVLARWSRMLLYQGYVESRSDLFKLGYDNAVAASQMSPNNGEVMMRLARVYEWNEEYDKALAAAQKAASLAPDSAETHGILAAALLDNNKLAEAETAARKGLQLDSNNAEAHRSMGFIYREKKDTNGMVSEFEKAAQADPNLVFRYVDLAAMYRSINDCTRAMATSQQALKIYVRSAMSHYVIALCQLAKGDLNGATESLKQISGISPASSTVKTLTDAIAAAKVTPTPTRTAVPTAVPPTATPTRVPPTATPALAPGIYVKDVRADPFPIHTNQFPTFQVTFINSHPIPIDSNWYIKVYEPGKSQSFGETTRSRILIPVGESTFASVNNWKATGSAQCRQYIARVWYQLPDGSLHEYPKPGGDSFQFYFNVCD